MRRLVLAVAMVLGTAAPTWADVYDAVDAYDRGDYATAYKEVLPLAEQGDAAAQALLGVMYETGRGVARDDARAAEWYRKAAEQGNAGAQSILGTMYAVGRGVARDDARAVEWYRKAAEQGSALAEYSLGLMYANGRGVARDDARAVECVKRLSILTPDRRAKLTPLSGTAEVVPVVNRGDPRGFV